MKVKLVYFKKGKEHKVLLRSQSLEDICEKIWLTLIGQSRDDFDKDTILTLPDGRSFRWSDDYAHYTFAKSRMDMSQFINVQFSNDFLYENK